LRGKEGKRKKSGEMRAKAAEAGAFMVNERESGIPAEILCVQLLKLPREREVAQA